MNTDIALFIIFVIAMSIFLVVNRKKVEIKGRFPLIYFVMYKSELGIKLINYLGNKLGWIKKLLWPLIILTIISMATMIYVLIKSIYLAATTTVKTMQLVLPFETGSQLYIPFMYWIIAIAVVATLHELAHGILCKVNGIPVKSTGFAFLGIIIPILPAAYVEPDEQVLKTKSMKQKNSMIGAGPIINIITGLIFLALLIVANSLVEGTKYETKNLGVEITAVGEQAKNLGMGQKETIKHYQIPGEEKLKPLNTQAITQTVMKAQQTKTSPMIITTDKGVYNFDTSKELGITIKQITQKPTNTPGKIIQWTLGLLNWLWIISISVGLINLLPAGPLDGGMVTKNLLEKGLGQKWGNKTATIISAISIIIIATLIVMSTI